MGDYVGNDPAYKNYWGHGGVCVKCHPQIFDCGYLRHFLTNFDEIWVGPSLMHLFIFF